MANIPTYTKDLVIQGNPVTFTFVERGVRGGGKVKLAIPSLHRDIVEPPEGGFEKPEDGKKLTVQDIAALIGDKPFALMVTSAFISASKAACKEVPPSLDKGPDGQVNPQLDIDKWLEKVADQFSVKAQQNKTKKAERIKELTGDLLKLVSLGANASPEQTRQRNQVMAELAELVGVDEEE